MAFSTDAMSHGMLPGVAIASVLGAAASAAAMAAGVSALDRSRCPGWWVLGVGS
ncbi:hypothetical protein R4I43_30675 [Saccharopolyspora sp. S2-29]|uniref:Uncharacterized protein n=1 Tax=Saccharopolyspora mangrovi TaxID=3082379 RepID=A0ABU6AJP1_9PSEU|nr:hypothetical protein [Saccharopolyspora sp. S2-29]MEB3371772.1 hypothetical protein [Saccharopolyspora sp. S2-29]